jgi:hypothetical protein
MDPALLEAPGLSFSASKGARDPLAQSTVGGLGPFERCDGDHGAAISQDAPQPNPCRIEDMRASLKAVQAAFSQASGDRATEGLLDFKPE